MIEPCFLVCRNKNCNQHTNGNEGWFIWQKDNDVDNDLFFCSRKCENEDKLRKELEKICQEMFEKERIKTSTPGY